MATINIGNLAFTHKGDYASGTAYVKNDVVYYSTNGNAYIAKQATTGNAPTNATYWNQFASGAKFSFRIFMVCIYKIFFVGMKERNDHFLFLHLYFAQN